jgi:hypothetical protein
VNVTASLTQRHLDLKNEFYDKVRARGQIPDSEARLGKQITRLRKLRVRDTAELAQLREDVLHLVRIVNQLTAENHQLRAELTAPSARVRVLPTQPQPATRPDARSSPSPGCSWADRSRGRAGELCAGGKPSPGCAPAVALAIARAFG